MSLFKFKIVNSINQGVLELFNPIDFNLFSIKISTVGYYSDDKEHFYDVIDSDITAKINSDKNSIFYSLDGWFSLELDTKQYNKLIKESSLDISCDFYYDGVTMSEDDDYETIETPPLIEIKPQIS